VTFETPHGEVTKECDLLITAIGYLPVQIAGLEVDGNRYRNNEGEISSGLYAVGWAKRGPSGVIGTNKSDAADVMKLLVSKLENPKASHDILLDLKESGVTIVDQAGWTRVNEAEVQNGEAKGKPRLKFLEIEQMLEIASTK
jgi:ferredoxin--NADP+ reductase